MTSSPTAHRTTRAKTDCYDIRRLNSGKPVAKRNAGDAPAYGYRRVAALVLATILLFAYLSHYRSSVKSASANISVLRSTAFIPKGTTALTLAKQGLFEYAAVPKEQVKEDAITDASVIQGQVALNDIYPAQQLTISDFGVTATSSALSGSADLLGTGSKTGTWRGACDQPR